MKIMVALLVWGAAAAMGAAEPVTFETLLRETHDLSALTQARDYGLAQQSSYDRSGGNGDCGQYLRHEGTAHVMAEMTGPGAIVRLWSANADVGQGRLKIYLDGAAEPALDAPFADLFLDKNPDFPSPLARRTSGGWISYVPIPYAKSCRVDFVTSKSNSVGQLYYQVTYRTYPAGTKVHTWSAALNDNAKAALGTAVAAWQALAQLAPATTEEADIAPGATRELFAGKGAGTIRELALAVPGADGPALRALVLRGAWDGEKEPSVLVPVADFFGSTWGVSNAWRSLALGRVGEVAYCRWPMPFAGSATLALENRGEKPVHVKYAVAADKLRKLPPSTLRFHARWQRLTTVRNEPFPILDVKGRGHYAGVIMNMQGRGGLGFLEGDEMSYPDCEPDPKDLAKGRTINGTGCEDYFNCGWYFGAGPTNVATHGCLYKSDRESRITAYRFNYADVVPFQRSLLYTLEHGGRNDAPGADYAGVTFWYQSEPHAAFALDTRPPELGLAILAPPPPPPPPKPHEVFHQAGGLEGESLLETAQISAGAPQPVVQNMAHYSDRWSGDNQLWWTARDPGQSLTVTFNAPQAGRYKVAAWFTKAVDYGQFDLAVNDQPVGARLDLYNDGVVRTGRVELGVLELKAGANTLKATVAGKNAEATSCMFGLDVLVLEPQQ